MGCWNMKQAFQPNARNLVAASGVARLGKVDNGKTTHDQQPETRGNFPVLCLSKIRFTRRYPQGVGRSEYPENQHHEQKKSKRLLRTL